ncbi:Hypothetical protein UVM_LOCUS336 [uncultured virus]|nr:Hypothetical protein UVM_LOCUS336 [uncultured virus]
MSDDDDYDADLNLERARVTRIEGSALPPDWDETRKAKFVSVNRLSQPSLTYVRINIASHAAQVKIRIDDHHSHSDACRRKIEQHGIPREDHQEHNVIVIVLKLRRKKHIVAATELLKDLCHHGAGYDDEYDSLLRWMGCAAERGED